MQYLSSSAAIPLLPALTPPSALPVCRLPPSLYPQFLLPGPFIKLGPLRAIEGTAEIAGCASAAGLVLILAACLSIYGGAMFQKSSGSVGIKTKDGRSIERDALYTDKGWSEFAAGFTIGGISGVAWAYICTQILPYYS